MLRQRSAPQLRSCRNLSAKENCWRLCARQREAGLDRLILYTFAGVSAVRIALARPTAKELCHQTRSPPCPRRWRATRSARLVKPDGGPSCLRTHRVKTGLESSRPVLFCSFDSTCQIKNAVKRRHRRTFSDRCLGVRHQPPSRPRWLAHRSEHPARRPFSRDRAPTLPSTLPSACGDEP